MPTTKELIGRQRAEYDLAIKAQFRLVVFQGFILIYSLAIANAEQFRYWLGLPLLFATIWLVQRSLRASNIRANSDRARRAIVLSEGLNLDLGPVLHLAVFDKLIAGADAASAREKESYYDSGSKPGLKRVIEYIEESAFWSRELMKESLTRSYWVVGGLAVLIFVYLLVVVPFLNSEWTFGLNGLIAGAATLIVSAGAVGGVIQYASAKGELDSLMTSFQNAKQTELNEAQRIFLVTEYYAIMNRAPLFLPGLYDALHSKIAERWATNKSELGG